MTDPTPLISGYFDNTLSSEELASLEAWIAADPANARTFAQHALLQSHIKDLLGSDHALLAEQISVELPHVVPPTARASAPATIKTGFWRRRGVWAAAAAVAVVAGLATFEFGRISSLNLFDDDDSAQNNAPAYITADAGALLKAPDGALRGEDGNRRGLAAGERLTLSDGYIELTFAAGAKVVMQAPASFTIESGSVMTLSSGKLAATVNGGGFLVNTPAGRVADLGTEFGVTIQDASHTQVEVFKGRVQLQPAAAREPGSAKQTLIAGQAATLSAGAVALDSRGASPDHYLRSLSTVTSSLDLVDLVCGGDGTGRRRGIGIDVFNGDSGALSQFHSETGDDLYHAVPGIDVIDGCFIPDGKSGPTQVDSYGHRYEFPPTSKESIGLLWAGGRAIDPYGEGLARTTIGGIDYSDAEHGILYMYSNKGVTFDLKAVEANHPGERLYQFRCIVGNTHLKTNHRQRTVPKSDLYVLVDGKLRYQRIAFSNHMDAFPVEVRLNNNDRFLTLVTTEGDDTTLRDCVILADPTLQTMIPPLQSDLAGGIR